MRLGVIGEKHPRWKGNDVLPESIKARGWREARRLFPVDGIVCEDCGEVPAKDHHHIDGDTDNNKRKNVALLCRSCHRKRKGDHRRKLRKH